MNYKPDHLYRVDETEVPQNVDILIYSETANGYAVAIKRDGVFYNSLTGQVFAPAPSHWTLLPPRPSGISGYRALSVVPS